MPEETRPTGRGGGVDFERELSLWDPLPRPDVLVADDDPSNLTTIEAALGDLAGRVVKARSGREALRLLLRDDFAVILLDVQMPGLDGFQTAELIRQRPRLRHVPIIFVTAYSHDEKDVLRGYALGAVDFLFKPIFPEVLRSKVSVFVELQLRAAEVQRQAELLRRLERAELQRQHATERQLWEAQALRRMNRRKDEFLAFLAHELRNPLAPLVTGLELVRRYGAGHQGLDRVRESMERQIHQLLRLVDDLLDLSRISRGKINIQHEHVDLSLVAAQAVENVRGTIDERKHELTVESVEEPLVVNGDEVRLTQVISNLLTNAARYTQQGGRIRLQLDADQGTAIVRVVDNGQGIAPEMIDRVFDLFVQEDRGRDGLGLGLTLVRQLVELHGGTVHAASAGKGRGTEFVVRLPLVEGSRRLPAFEGDAANGAPAHAEAADPPLDVVVVEDEPDIREGLKDLLESWGHSVRCAEDGTRGIEEILDRPPDVALIDIAMPGLDGYEVAERVGAALGDDVPKLVALTGFGRVEDRRRARAAGFHVHLTKPARVAQLRSALRRDRDDSHLDPGQG